MQGTEDWRKMRVGLATASNFGAVRAKGKSGEAVTRRDYKMQLAVERLTGTPVDSLSNAAMQWGTDHEEQARLAFAIETGLFVDQVDFVRHPTLAAGASPDGLIGYDEGLEIKCPYNSAIHIETFLSGMPSKHKPQVQGALWITGRRVWHFVSFDPRMPKDFQLYRQTVTRDEAYIKELEADVEKFLAEVDVVLETLKERLKNG